MPEHCPEDRVRSVIVRLLAKWQWQLASVDELVTAVGQASPAGAELTEKQIGYLARGEYGRCLHAAARGADRGRQERAFTEIGAYLYALARARGYPAEHVQEAVQAALVRIYARSEECRNPAAFLHWCWLQLRETLRPPSASLGGDAIELDKPSGDDDEEAAEIADERAISPEQRAVCVALWKQFLDRITALCTGEAKRAANQIAAVLSKFLAGLEDREIAEQMVTTTANVQVLRSHGLQRLRGDQEIVQISRALWESGCTSVAI